MLKHHRIIIMCAIICYILMIGIALFFTLTKQKIVYEDNISCDKLKDAILLDINSGYSLHVYNEFFGRKWDFKRDIDKDEAKRYYEEYCLGGKEK